MRGYTRQHPEELSLSGQQRVELLSKESKLIKIITYWTAT
jgi:hypothetical protein